MSARSSGKHIAAAGAVLWRPGDDGIDIALIHRPHYDDWSLPKGKLDPGETAIAAAVREITEETGIRARLGRYLTHVTYQVNGTRTKRVDYWAAEAIGGSSAGAAEAFTPNDEVDQLRWLPVERAAEQLTYDADRNVLAAFTALPPDTLTLLLVRHAKAGSRAGYPGDDLRRPLEPAGVAQARALVPVLAAFGARYVHSADPVRCIQTVTPIAEFLGTEVVIEPAMSESAYAADPYAAEVTLRKIAALGDVRVVCSQGKVIPGLLQALAQRDGTPGGTSPGGMSPGGTSDGMPDGMSLRARPTRKAGCWVLSLHQGRLAAADYIDSPLSTR